MRYEVLKPITASGIRYEPGDVVAGEVVRRWKRRALAILLDHRKLRQVGEEEPLRGAASAAPPGAQAARGRPIERPAPRRAPAGRPSPKAAAPAAARTRQAS